MRLFTYFRQRAAIPVEYGGKDGIWVKMGITISKECFGDHSVVIINIGNSINLWNTVFELHSHLSHNTLDGPIHPPLHLKDSRVRDFLLLPCLVAIYNFGNK